jgi:predicted nucleic acid-binding protein
LSIVVDASVLIAATVDAGPAGIWAEGVLESGDLHAPELVLVEATNILRRLERAKKISSAEAAIAHQHHLQLPLALYPFEPAAERVWELRHTLTSYDAWYVALAEMLELPLATLDGRLARASGPSCAFVLP